MPGVTDLEFYVDAVLSGGPLDLGAGAEPDRIESVLGSAFIDARQPNSLRRDYGLLEFFFTRDGDGWLAQGVSIQVHRLVHAPAEELVPLPLRTSYGAFSPFLTFEALQAALAERIGEPDFLVAHEFPGSLAYQVAHTPRRSPC